MRLIIMFIAIALAAGAFFTTMHFTAKESDSGLPVRQPQVTYKDVPTVNVYTARQDIPIGVIVTQDMLDIQPWPQHLLLPDMVPADPNQAAEIVQMVTRTPFAKGEPIIMNKLANAKDPSFLAAALPKGMRVVTIAADPISGVGGFVFPGDHVDVLITHEIDYGKEDKRPETLNATEPDGKNITITKKDRITEVLLSNILVLAINQKSTAHGGEPPTPPNNVSLEVSASDAQKLVLATTNISSGVHGHLSLALRSLKDKDEMALPRPTGVGDLSRLTPPSYFPVLYDAAGRANFAAGATESEVNEETGKDTNSITIVRGVKPESVEVSRP